MFRAALPSVCPQCGEKVPRAAARRCPHCRTPFFVYRPPPVASRATPPYEKCDNEDA